MGKLSHFVEMVHNSENIVHFVWRKTELRCVCVWMKIWQISCLVYGWPLFNLLWSPFIHSEYTFSLHFTLRLEFCICRNSIYKNETLCIAILLLWRKALRRDYIGGINHITKGSLHIQPASTHRPPTPPRYFPQIF